MARDPNSETRKHYEDTLGKELGALFSELWQELAFLHTLWSEFCVLFVDNPDGLRDMNVSARAFFYIHQKALWENILLHLTRITDPARNIKGQLSLSVLALSKLVKPEIRRDVSRLAKDAHQKTLFARDWRNRYIAHKDLQLALSDPAVQPLAVGNKEAVEETLKALNEVLNTTEYSYNNAKTIFRVRPHPHGAKRLFDLLQKGRAAEERELLLLRIGK